MHALVQSHGWQVYAKHLTNLLADTQARMATCDVADLPHVRARWVALGDALDIPRALVSKARRAREESAA